MVEIAYPPSNFDLARALVGADTLPAPAEPEKPSWGMPPGWGARAGEFKQGYLTVTAEARQRLLEAEALRKRMAGTTKHAADRRREQAERDAQAEAERQAAGDPREQLAAAHRLRAEALAAVERLVPQAERGAGLVAELEARQIDVTAAVDSADRDAAERLRAAIAAGADELPLNRRADAMQAEAAKAAGKLGVARTALAQLEGEQAEARTAAEGWDRAVRRAAIQVLIDEGAAIAALDAAAAEKRRQLDALAVELTSQTRSLDGSGNALRLPAKISRVLAGPPDQQLVTARSVAAAQPWAEQFAALVAEPGAA